MKCEACGKEIANSNAQFCPICGAEVNKPEVKFCPECGKEYGPDYHYCEVCGRKLAVGRAASFRPEPRVQPANWGSATPAVMTLNSMTHYRGEPTVSVNGVLGKLEITADSLRFHGTWGAIGGLLAAKKLEFPIKDIADVYEGKYMGIYQTIVIKLRNQELHSFVPGLPGHNQSVKDAIDIIRHCSR